MGKRFLHSLYMSGTAIDCGALMSCLRHREPATLPRLSRGILRREMLDLTLQSLYLRNNVVVVPAITVSLFCAMRGTVYSQIHTSQSDRRQEVESVAVCNYQHCTIPSITMNLSKSCKHLLDDSPPKEQMTAHRRLTFARGYDSSLLSH